MRVLVVAGARPNFMKVAPILRALDAAGHVRVLVHTGQHYDAAMSGAFFADFGMPQPDYHLGVNTGSHAVQTAGVMRAFEPILMTVRPDWVVFVGDVNSTLAAALVTAKLRQDLGCRLAHVEAGLRSRDWTMPEGVNRVLTDRLSDRLFVHSPEAVDHLLAEGIERSSIELAGNVMIDTLLRQLPAARALDIPARMGLEPRRFAVVTLHRPSNVDDGDALRTLLEALGDLSRDMPVVWPVHPRARRRVEEFSLHRLLDGITTVEPVGYLDMLSLVDAAAIVLTDSGGLQEETTVLGVPCVTLCAQTERPITISRGTNRLAPWPLTVGGVLDCVRAALADRSSRKPEVPDGWDGRAAERIVAALARSVDSRRSSLQP